MPKQEIVLLAFVILTIGAGQNSETWKKFVPQDKSFSVSLPNEPIIHSNTVGELKDYSMMADTEFATYEVGYTEYRKSLDSEKQLLDIALSTLIRISGGTLVNKKKITIDSYLGYEITLKSQAGTFIDTTRVYLVSNRLYRLRVIVAPPKKDISNDILYFFSSFKLHPKAENIS